MVKRFDCDREYVGDGEYVGVMVQVPEGDYVEYSHYKEVVAKLKKEIAFLEHLLTK